MRLSVRLSVRLAMTVLAIAAMSATASATPLEVRHARSIRVALNGRSEDATALRAAPGGGWRLELARGAAGTLVVRDVTLGATGPRTFELAVAPGASVVLDAARFHADHAYRAELRRGLTVVGSVLLYLSPPPRTRGPVTFDDREATAPASDDELVASDKGSL
jgi:hypothetical protein